MYIIRRYIIYIFEIRVDDMYIIIRNIVLVMVVCFLYIVYVSIYFFFIIIRGVGGDVFGVIVIYDNWWYGIFDLVNFIDIFIDKIRLEKYSCVLIIG